MRLWLLAMLILFGESGANAQCPIEVGRVSVDAANKELIIHYSNTSSHAAREVGFTLTNRDIQNRHSISTKVTARGTVVPGQNRMAIFPTATLFPNISNLARPGMWEVQVLSVSFDDDSRWLAPSQHPCAIAVSQP
jgi:hypothetical protein